MDGSRTVGARGVRKILSCAAFAAALALVAAPAAQASLINVQFGQNSTQYFPATPAYTGAGVLGAAGDQWNLVLGNFSDSAPRNNLALTDVLGAATSVTLGYTGATGYFDASSSLSPPLMGSTSYADLLDAFLYTTGTSTFTFSGLTAGASYDLILYAIANKNGRETRVTVDGVTESVIAAATPGLVLGSTYAEFTGVIADPSGHIVIAVQGGQVGQGSGVEADVNGIQLTESSIAAIPEPASAPLLLAGLTLLGWHRFRRSRHL